MKDKDLLVISALRNNCRQTLSEMSRSIRVPLSTIHDRIKGLYGDIVMKHTAIVDFSRLGYNTRACVLLKVNKKDRTRLQNHLGKCSHVNSLSKVNNGHDYMIEMVFEHIKDMEDYMETLEQEFNFKNKEIFYIIDDIKREEFLSSPRLAKMMMMK